MHITLVQLDSVWENKPANFEKVRALLAKAPPAKGGIVVLPEMFSTGFSLDLSQTLRTGTASETTFCADLAKTYGCCVVGGVIDEVGDRARNLAVAFSPDGELARYQKQRPFTGAGEHEKHTPGKTATVFDWGVLRIAPLVCYDLRFPELFRAGLALGATAFVVIAAWPSRRIEHWVTLLKARAIENQAYVIGVNRTGNEPRFQYCGRSVVIDPHGNVVIDAGEIECVATAEIDPSLPTAWRTEFPAVRDFLGA
jgi:omega-amidase